MISVVMPVYNTNHIWLKIAIESLLKQTFREFEIIIVNDGSTNLDTINTLNEYKKYCKIITTSKKSGVAYSCNLGIKNAKFDIIARMDSDDICISNRFEIQFNYLKNNPNVDLVGSNIRFLYKENERWILGSKTRHPKVIDKQAVIKYLWFINHPTVMFKKSKIIDIGGYSIDPYCVAEDFDLWARMVLKGMILHNIPNILLYYREHRNNFSKIFKSNFRNWAFERRDFIFGDNKTIKENSIKLL